MVNKIIRHAALLLLMYLPSWYCETSSICMTAFLLFMSGCKPKTVMSLPLFTYVQMCMIDLTKLQYSTLMCAMYVFYSKGKYGTTHRLSSSTSPFRICMVANLTPSSADLLYIGCPSFPVTVLHTNARGYRLDHFPSIMHGEFGFSVPQNQCIIVFVTTSFKSLSTSASGISAQFKSSILFEVILS